MAPLGAGENMRDTVTHVIVSSCRKHVATYESSESRTHADFGPAPGAEAKRSKVKSDVSALRFDPCILAFAERAWRMNESSAEGIFIFVAVNRSGNACLALLQFTSS